MTSKMDFWIGGLLDCWVAGGRGNFTQQSIYPFIRQSG
jgi:hypothetical protein